MVLPSRSVSRYRIREERKTALQERQADILNLQLLQQEIDADYPNVPDHHLIATVSNDKNESIYEEKIAEFYRKKKEQVTDGFFKSFRGLNELEEKVANVQLEIEDTEREDTAKPIVEDMLALCAKVPAVNQALSDHFHHAPADKWQSAMREIRAQMDEYRPQVLESVNNEFKELVAQDRPQLEQTLLEPLRKQDETIEQLENEMASYCSDAEKLIELCGRNAQLRQRPLEKERKVTQVFSLVIDNQQNILQAVLGWEQAARTNAEQLQGNVTAAETSASEMEKKFQQANARANALQKQVKTAEDKAKELEGKLSEGNEKARDLEDKLDNANAKVENLEGEVGAANEEVKALEGKVKTADSNAKTLELQVTTANEGCLNANRSVRQSQGIMQGLRRYAQSQLSLFGISDDEIQNEILEDWDKVNAASPTLRANIMDTVEHYQLMFVVPPTDLVVIDTGDLAVAQIWFLVQSRPEALLSVRHYACRADLSPKQLHILQDAVFKAIRVIVNAQPQDVFRPAIVAIHAIGWLYARAERLSDHVERRSGLVSLWNALTTWLHTHSPSVVSRILRKACEATHGALKEDSRAVAGLLDVVVGENDMLTSSNSGLEPGQALLPDPGMGQFAWFFEGENGKEMRLFGRGDVCYAGVNIATAGIVLRFADVGIEICLCRRADQIGRVLQWVLNYLDSSCVHNV